MLTVSLITLIGLASASPMEQNSGLSVVDCLQGGCTPQGLLDGWRVIAYDQERIASKCPSLMYFFAYAGKGCILGESCRLDNGRGTAWTLSTTQTVVTPTQVSFVLDSTIESLPKGQILSLSQKIQTASQSKDPMFLRLVKVWKRDQKVIAAVVEHPLIHDMVVTESPSLAMVRSKSLWLKSDVIISPSEKQQVNL